VQRSAVPPAAPGGPRAAVTWPGVPGAPDKTVVSVSLGSARRDADEQVELLGHRVRMVRRGVGGDLEAARRLVGELDGRVDAIGLGGTDLYLKVGDRRYTIRDAARIAAAAKRTPVVCGAGLKDSLERGAVAALEPVVGWRGRRVLMVSSVDRFGMAEALAQQGADVLYGDLIFGLGIDVPLRSLEALKGIARVALPVIARLPFRWFYPTGASQDAPPRPRHQRHYRWAEVLAGDWHYIRAHAATDLTGKDVLTNTTTAEDVAFLRAAGARRLVTTTPRIGGRSVGTNLLEAAFVAVEGAPGELTRARYEELIAAAGLGPTVLDL